MAYSDFLVALHVNVLLMKLWLMCGTAKHVTVTREATGHIMSPINRQHWFLLTMAKLLPSSFVPKPNQTHPGFLTSLLVSKKN